MLPVLVTSVTVETIVRGDKVYINADDILRTYSGILVMTGSPYEAMTKLLDALERAKGHAKEMG